ncbi:unnamed protein product, partial [marine sediment metagenome]
SLRQASWGIWNGLMRDLRVVKVEPKRLDDIDKSYSGDLIAEDWGKHLSHIRLPFRFENQLWVNVGSCHASHEAYRIVPLSQFRGETKRYSDGHVGEQDAGDWENSNFEKWRNDPMGFYHGMTVVRGKSTWVLVGPPVLFQGALPHKCHLP